MIKKKIALLLTAAICLTGCGSTASNTNNKDADSQVAETNKDEIKSASRDVFAMDTYMTITCYGDECEEAVQAAVDEINRLDALLSVGNNDSAISTINHNGSGALDEDTAAIVEETLYLYDTTAGAFDITIYPLMELWGFTSGNYRIPDQNEIDEQLSIMGSDKLVYDSENRSLALSDGQGIDLGGIAKGFTSDRLMEIFAEHKLVSGVVSLGGNVECYGTKTDGSMWRCGIRDPLKADEASAFLGIIEVADEAVITSGAYERYFEVDEKTGEISQSFENGNITDAEGKAYHHIIDTSTGYPAETGILSVSIVSKSGILADGLSTSCYIMGLDDSIDYWREHGSDFGFIIMTDDGQIYITEDLENRFTTDYPLVVISQQG